VEEIAGAGRNRSTYGLLSYSRTGVGRLRTVFFEHQFRRVQDDIPDEFSVLEERPRRIGLGYRGIEFGNLPSFFNTFRQDDLFYQDSNVDESYLEAHLRPWSTLNLVQKVRLRLNWQQGGVLPSGRAQLDRRLDFWTLVSRADYTYEWGKLRIQPQFKFLLLRLQDQREDFSLRSEWRTIPIVRLGYPLLERTRLQIGLQGLGPLPYRFKDRAVGRNSFEQRTAFVTLTNKSKYFGYDLRTIVSFQRDRKGFDEVSRQRDEFDLWTFFVRALIGFTEYGRLL
jgi:hypothetical protein